MESRSLASLGMKTTIKFSVSCPRLEIEAEACGFRLQI